MKTEKEKTPKKRATTLPKVERHESIKEYIENKPSRAIFAMINGLIRQNRRKNFRIDMDTFGDYNTAEKYCFGCAATCTIQEITGINFINGETTNIETRWEHLKIKDSRNWLSNFESQIDTFRSGSQYGLRCVLTVCGVNTDKAQDYYHLLDFNIRNDNWKKEIPKVRKLIKALEADGL